MRKKIKLTHYILLLNIVLFSCNSTNNETDFDKTVTDESVKSNPAGLTYNRQTRQFEERILDSAGEKHQLNFYNDDFVLVQRQTYNESGHVDSLIAFYPSGQIFLIRHYLFFEHDSYREFPNSWICYDEKGDILVEETSWGEILNEKKYYDQDEHATLKVKLIGGQMRERDGVRVYVYDFDKNPEPPNEVLSYDLDSSTGFIEIPLPTHSVGLQEFKFTFVEYKDFALSEVTDSLNLEQYKSILDEAKSDSITKTHAIFMKYEYFVK